MIAIITIIYLIGLFLTFILIRSSEYSHTKDLLKYDIEYINFDNLVENEKEFYEFIYKNNILLFTILLSWIGFIIFIIAMLNNGVKFPKLTLKSFKNLYN